MYKKPEFNKVALQYPGNTVKGMIAIKFDFPMYFDWVSYQTEFERRISNEFKIKPFSFPGNTFFGVKIFAANSEVLRAGLYLYISFNSLFYIIYTITNDLKIGYPTASDLPNVKLLKEIFKETLAIELPHKYWGIQPEGPYYYDEHVPDKKLAYFDLFFGGPSLYGDPFHKDAFSPINDYGINLEENFPSNLSTIMLLSEDPMAPE